MTLLQTAPLEEFLRETIGLAADSLGRGAVERAAKRRMAEAECPDVDTYVRRLRGDEELRQKLIEELVVPETWFFRDRQPFLLLARLAKTRRAPLRVLSMPCSTGEEPYSIAMTLLDAGLAPGAFAIDAVDISEVSLAAARRGSYAANSFRGDEGRAQEKWFHAEAGRRQLQAAVKERVTFHHGNLFTFAAEGRYDFVFCRNLLIYFDAPAQGVAVRRLLDLLKEDGVLFAGHAEAAVMLREGLAGLPEPRTFAFTRRPTAPVKTEPVRMPVWTKPLVMTNALPFADVKPRTAEAAAVSLADIRAMADRGDLDGAVKQVQALIATDGPGVEAYHLLAVLEDARGEAEAAEAAYRKVLYLEPRHEEALLHLALLLEKRGGEAEAARLRLRARRGGEA
jgi:chemotaxis protein methyltransferase WspC